MATTRPTVERRQLGIELRRLRTARGRSQKDVAAVIEYDTSMVSRVERGERSLKSVELVAVLDFLDVSGDKRAEILELGRRARARQRRRMYSDPLPGAFRRLGDLEEIAAEIYYSSGELVPGLLQTENYLRALMRTAISIGTATDDIEARVRFRLERQELLARNNSPRMWFVVGEPALRRPVGSVGVLREQLQHLLGVVDDHPRVTLQVAPLSVVDHPLLGGSICVLRFAGRGPDVVHQSTFVGGGVYIDDEANVAECFRAYDRLRAVALGPAQSRAFVERCIEELPT
jgi:transcriptional regulator with XRE-family HTH domain